MSLLSLIAVFLIEQLQPLNYRRVVEEPLAAWADFIESRFNAGEYRQGVIAWWDESGVPKPRLLQRLRVPTHGPSRA